MTQQNHSYSPADPTEPFTHTADPTEPFTLTADPIESFTVNRWTTAKQTHIENSDDCQRSRKQIKTHKRLKMNAFYRSQDKTMC